MTHRGLVFFAVVACILAGCNSSLFPLYRPMPPPVAGDIPLTPLSPGKLEDPTGYMLILRFQLITVTVPIGAVSDTEELWSYLNEEPVGATIGASLARNGVRVGFGGEETWPQVARLLRSLTGQSLVRSSITTPPGGPREVVLKENAGDQTLFVFRSDRTLIGEDYPPCDNVLMLTGTINYDDTSAVHLMGRLVLRSNRRQTRYVEEPAVGYVLTSEPTYYPLDDMAFQVKVPVRSFLVIGPGREVRRANSPGRQFLVRSEAGLEFETVVVIATEIFAAPIRGK